MLSLLPMKLRVVISSEAVSSSNSAPEENKFEKKKEVYRDFKLQPGKKSSSLSLLFFNS